MRRASTMRHKRAANFIASITLAATGLGAALLLGGFERPASPAQRAPTSVAKGLEATSAARPQGPQGTAALVEQTSREGSGAFSARPGEHFIYDLDTHWRTDLRQPSPSEESVSGIDWRVGGAMPERVTASLKGRLHVLVVDRQENDYVLRFWLEAPRGIVRAGGSVQTMDGVELQQKAMARFTTDGRIVGYSFGPTVTEDTRTLLVSLFAQSHQFVVHEGEDAWTVDGLNDEIGPFTARFSWRDGRGASDIGESLHRRVVAYGSSVSQKVEQSSAEARFSSGWIAGARVRERRSAEVGGAFSATTEVDLDMGLVERTVEPVDRADVPWSPDAWKLRFPAAKRPATFDVVGPRTAADQPDPRVALARTLERLEAIVAGGLLTEYEGFEVWKEIADLVRRSPDVVLPELVDLVRAGRLDDGALNWLVSAIGAAGSDGSAPAIAALTQMIADPALAERVRLAAVFSAHQVRTGATPAMIDAVTDLLLERADLGRGGALPTAAALLLGTFAGEQSGPAGHSEILEAALDLVREESFARGESSVYFDALLNSGRPDLIERAFDFLSDPSEVVRRDAARALSGLDGDPRVRQAAETVAAGDTSAMVRSAAVETLGTLPPSPETTRLLADLALGADPQVSSSAVSALGEYAGKGSSEAHGALTRIATEPSSVGKKAAEILAGIEDDVSAVG